MTELSQRIYEVVKQIPSGKVGTYGQVALLAGKPKAPRAVGAALHRNPEFGIIPCHRVVFSNGAVTDGFAFGGPAVQRKLLEEEGIVFDENGRINMKEYAWRP